MGSNLTKYFADELTSEEKEKLLLEVSCNGELQEDFVEYQNLIALIDWTLSEGNEELAQRKLSEFMYKMKEQSNKQD